MVTSGMARRSVRPRGVDRLRRLGLLDHGWRKFGGNAVIVNGDQADGLGRIHAADALDHLDAGKAGDAARLAVRPPPARCAWRRPGRTCPAHIRCAPSCRSAPAASRWRLSRSTPIRRVGVSLLQPADDAGFISFAMLFQPRQQPVARSGRRAVLGRDRHRSAGGASLLSQASGRASSFAVVIGAGDFDDADFRQFAALDEAVLLAAFDGAFGFQFFQDALEHGCGRSLSGPAFLARSRLLAPAFAPAVRARAPCRGRACVVGVLSFFNGLYSPAISGVLALVCRGLAGLAFAAGLAAFFLVVVLALAPAFSPSALLCRFRFCGSSGLGALAGFLLLAAALGRAFGDQRQRLFHGHAVGLGAFGQGGIGFAVADIGAELAFQHLDRPCHRAPRPDPSGSGRRGGPGPWPSSRQSG